MSQDLQKFNPLKAEIEKFLKPTLTIRVTSFKESEGAIEAGKTVKSYQKELDKKRRELVDPLNAQVKAINDYVKQLSVPLEQAENHIKAQLSAFAAEQEKIKQEELRKAEEERRRKETELLAKQEAERAALASQVSESNELSELFGMDGPLAQSATQAQFEEKAAEERALLNSEHAQAVYDASQMQIKNTRKSWKCEAIDLSIVPREFLIIQLNTQAVLAAARAGVTTIPGVRLWQEVGVAIGSKTYVPRRALGEK